MSQVMEALHLDVGAMGLKDRILILQNILTTTGRREVVEQVIVH